MSVVVEYNDCGNGRENQELAAYEIIAYTEKEERERTTK